MSNQNESRLFIYVLKYVSQEICGMSIKILDVNISKWASIGCLTV